MNLTSSVKIAMARLRRFAFPGLGGQAYGAGGGWGGLGNWFRHLLPGSQFDYRREAGIPWENSIVGACVAWGMRNFPESPCVVTRPGKGSKRDIVEGHPLAKLIRRPNPHYGGRTLWAGTILSYMVDGNAYWFKEKSASGKVINLYYIPHFQIEPRWDMSGTDFITFYEYRVNNKSYRLDADDIIHFRQGIDPANTRKGISFVHSVLREICTDNEAATFAAALLRNSAVPGLIISTKDSADELTPDQSKALKEKINLRLTGDERGSTMVATLPIEVTQLGFSPEQLVFDKVRSIPVGRITAIFGFDAMAIGLPSDNKTYANYGESIEAAYRGFMIPTGSSIADDLTFHPLPELQNFDETYEAGFDYSNVKALQDDLDKRDARARDNFQKGLISQNEGRALIDHDEVPDGDKFIWDFLADQQAAAFGMAGDDQDPSQAGNGKQPSGKPSGKKPADDTSDDGESDDTQKRLMA